MADMYRFQWEEIDAAALQSGEDEWLAEEKQKLSNAERLFASASAGYEALYGNKQAMEAVSKAMGHVVRNCEGGPKRSRVRC